MGGGRQWISLCLTPTPSLWEGGWRGLGAHILHRSLSLSRTPNCLSLPSPWHNYLLDMDTGSRFLRWPAFVWARQVCTYVYCSTGYWPPLFAFFASMGHVNEALRDYTESRSSFLYSGLSGPWGGPLEEDIVLLPLPLSSRHLVHVHAFHCRFRRGGKTELTCHLPKTPWSPWCPCKGSFFRTGTIDRETRTPEG